MKSSTTIMTIVRSDIFNMPHLIKEKSREDLKRLYDCWDPQLNKFKEDRKWTRIGFMQKELKVIEANLEKIKRNAPNVKEDAVKKTLIAR